MNIYNYIYCYFRDISENNGRIDCSAYVLGTALIHVFLVNEILHVTLGFRLAILPDYGEYGRNKYMHVLLVVPFWIALIFFYNRKRTDELLKRYNQKYGRKKTKNTVRMLAYKVLPLVIAVTMALIRQNS